MDEIIYRAKKIAYMYQEWKRLNKLTAELKKKIEWMQNERNQPLETHQMRLINGVWNGCVYSKVLETWLTFEFYDRYISQKIDEYKKAMEHKKDIEFRLSIWIKNGEEA